jgi:hypothetical protein
MRFASRNNLREGNIMRATRRRHLLGLVAAVLVLWPAVAGAQVSVLFTWNQPNIQSFYLSDFDPSDTAVHPDLFTLQILNSTGLDQVISLRFYILAGMGGATQLVTASTDPFTLGAGGLMVTNRDLSQVGQDYTLSDYDVDTDAAEEIVNQLLETGVLPSDTYTFRLEVYSEVEALMGSGEYALVVSNPSRVDLFGPGGEFGGTLPVIATSNPQFFWSSDAMGGTASTRFSLKVVRVDDATSGEEAIDGFAVWQAAVTDQTTTIYPASVEAIPLEAGSSYAWQVTRIVETSGGEREIESEIFWFKLEDPAGGIFGASVDEEVAAMLQQIASLQGVGSEIEGFTPIGTVLVDGRPVNLNGLRELLRRILSGEIQVTSIIIR